MIFPFTSESKRMGIIVRNQSSGKLIFYLKGAENILIPKLKPFYRSTVDERSESLAMEGLRTLVITQKCLEEDYFTTWVERYKEANADLINR
jgi:phospholipid-translocating ATPase